MKKVIKTLLPIISGTVLLLFLSVSLVWVNTTFVYASSKPLDNVKQDLNLLTGTLPLSTVTVLGSFGGTDAELFRQSMLPFEARTGISVTYEYSGDFENEIWRRVSNGTPPDVAFFPQPGLLGDIAQGGYTIDLSEWFTPTYLQGQYHQSWLDMATNKGQIIGVWYKASLKSLVWYPVPEFTDAGYQIPTTWNELLALSDQMVTDGRTPWCIGIESGGASGWVATDWVEDIMLRTTSPGNYDKWVDGDLKFIYPEVKNAVQTMSNIWFNDAYVLGGRHAITSTFFGDAVTPLFDNPPGCWLHRQGSWIPLFFPSGAQIGVDVDYFSLPPIDVQYGEPALVAGDIAGVFADRPEVRELVQYLTTGESLRAWIEAGGVVAPHKDADLNWYPTADRGFAEIISNATTIRFDGSDLMPGQVGAGSFWTGMVDYVNGEDLDTVLRNIDKSWPAQTVSSVVTDTGTVTSTDGLVNVTFPTGSISVPITITITTSNDASQPTTGLHFAGRSIEINAVDENGNPVTQFASPFTLTLAYNDADWQTANIDKEEDLGVFWWTGVTWVDLCPYNGYNGCQQITTTNRFIIPLDHLSEFAVAAEATKYIYLPLVIK